jgi:hypothetical protein
MRLARLRGGGRLVILASLIVHTLACGARAFAFRIDRLKREEFFENGAQP